MASVEISEACMGRRIAIIGAGAVGAYVGGYLARAGEDVTVVDPWPEHVEHMRREGLELSGLSDEECFSTPITAMHITDVQSFARAGAIDIAFICMKSYDTGWATMLVKDYLAPGGFVVSLQNCINEERIAGIVGWGKTLGCIASQIAVELCGPGQVRRGVPRGGDGGRPAAVLHRQQQSHDEPVGRTLVEARRQRHAQRGFRGIGTEQHRMRSRARHPMAVHACRRRGREGGHRPGLSTGDHLQVPARGVARRHGGR
jgi:hypothetical protein